MGALDVCPFIPVRDVSMADCVLCAEAFGQRLAEELDVPVYLYGEAARTVSRRTLPAIRAGEYEALPEKLKKAEWAPDFGPSSFVPSWGATATGARKFLIAFNINLLSTKEQAHRIALNLREQGRGQDQVGPAPNAGVTLWGQFSLRVPGGPGVRVGRVGNTLSWTQAGLCLWFKHSRASMLTRRELLPEPQVAPGTPGAPTYLQTLQGLQSPPRPPGTPVQVLPCPTRPRAPQLPSRSQARPSLQWLLPCLSITPAASAGQTQVPQTPGEGSGLHSADTKTR